MRVSRKLRNLLRRERRAYPTVAMLLARSPEKRRIQEQAEELWREYQSSGPTRSSFYAMKSRQQATAERPPAKRRGPKPSISDEALLVAIEADLEASPWEGEGHRKVWARLRVCRGWAACVQAVKTGWVAQFKNKHR